MNIFFKVNIIRFIIKAFKISADMSIYEHVKRKSLANANQREKITNTSIICDQKYKLSEAQAQQVKYPKVQETTTTVLVDIDSLTNSMNYVPVVVTCTNSINFSGTKEAAETSISNAQDACNADAPESSGNSNPTPTSTNSSADHMQTLAAETLIPTISSPVPTACLNDSPKPSSDIRLISKRVTSQDDTPSLDSILTLTNMFEDILGVTTNTDDTNGVEADLGNMETTITASLTPTLRIHKDIQKVR
nr:hypothetical protein [Tanacetum cinerariifolium]